MATTDIAKQLRLLNPGNLDFWYGPYSSVADANAAVPTTIRLNKTVAIQSLNGITEWWWRNGTTNNALIPKADTENLVSSNRELSSDYLMYQPGLFSYSNTTGLLSSTQSCVLKIKKGNSIIIPAFTDLNLIPVDAPANSICILYIDALVPSTTANITANIQTAVSTNMPDLPVNNFRIFIGYVTNSVGNYPLYSEKLELFYQIGNSRHALQIASEDILSNSAKIASNYLALKREISTSEGFIIGDKTNIVYNRATGVLTMPSLMAYYNEDGVRYYLVNPEGQAALRVTDLQVGLSSDPNNTIRLVYIDIPTYTPGQSFGNATVISKNRVDMVPVPALNQRVLIGVCNKISASSYDFYAPIIDVYDDSLARKTKTQLSFESISTNYNSLKREISTSEGFTDGDRTGIVYDRSTGILNSTTLLNLTSANGLRYFVVSSAGAATFRITNFQVGSDADANNTVRLIYSDVPVPATGNTNMVLTTGVRGSLPVIPVGYQRFVLGISIKISSTSYDFYSPQLDIYDDSLNRKTKIQKAIEGAGAIVSNKDKVNQAFYNKYTKALDKAPKFKKKFLEQLEDVNIVLLGDSLFAKQDGATLLANLQNLPNGCSRNHVQYQLWNFIAKNKPVSNRFETVPSVFSYNGTWTVLGNGKFDTPAWAGEFRSDISIIQMSNSNNASVGFSWVLSDFEKLNFVYKQTLDGVSSATLNIAEGNSKVQVFDGTNWIEANGYVFTQKTVNNPQGLGYALHLSDQKVKLRRLATTGTVNITVSKGANSDFLYFWGTERWNGPALFITNVGRGGRTIQLLQNNFLNDVVGRKPDLVVFELPMTNEFSNFARIGYQTILDHVQDFIWGDRPGFETNMNLKYQSNNFTDFEVVCVMPHYRSLYFNGDQPVNYALEADLTTVVYTADSSPYSTNQRVKSLINSKSDLNYIDMGDSFIAEAKNLGWTIQQSTTGSSPVSTESFTTTNDSVHQNDFGSYVWAKILGGVLGNI